MFRTSVLELIKDFLPEEVHGYLADSEVSDLMIQQGKVSVDIGGRVSAVACPEVSDDALYSVLELLARSRGQDINREYPILDTRLEDGQRVAAMVPPCSPLGPMLTIRRFPRWYDLVDLVQQGVLPLSVANELAYEVDERRCNVLIAGGTGSGKTTLARAFLSKFPRADRIVVIEKPMEFVFDHPHAIRWEAVDGFKGQPEITVAQLVRAALRHRPDRIIVGEIRGEEAYDFLQALNTGHGGSISTIHATSARGALYRLADLATAARPNLNPQFVREEVAYALQLVVYMERGSDGKRRVLEAARLRACSKDGFVLDSIL